MVLRKNKKNTTLEDKHNFIAVEDDHFENIVLTEKKKLIVELLDKLGEECKKTLQLFYYEKMRMNKMLMTESHCAHHIKLPMHMNKRSNRKVNHTGKM